MTNGATFAANIKDLVAKYKTRIVEFPQIVEQAARQVGAA